MSEKMNYDHARLYLEEIAKSGNLLGLEPMQNLLNELGNPQDELKFIHIAGTNGKGSVLAYISTILKESGYLVGRYVSPTLFSYRERIQVNEEYITQDAVVRYVERIKEVIERMKSQGKELPTIFEVETAMAFLFFLEKKCDVVVLETGMGGDTDATNVVKTTLLEVIVPISMDHMEFLGDTLAEIAEHKAGIIKRDTRVVTALQEPEALEVIREKAHKEHAKLTIADWTKAKHIRFGIEEQAFSYGEWDDLMLHLGGSYQIKNAVIAVESIKALRTLGFVISDEDMKNGFSKTVWKGRFTVINRDPLVIIDGAHNPAGAKELRTTIEECLGGRKIYGICGVFKDKEYEKILEEITPYLCGLITIQTPDNPRALPAENLAEAAKKYLKNVNAEKSIETAVKTSMDTAKCNDGIVLAFGSLSFLGEIRKIVEK